MACSHEEIAWRQWWRHSIPVCLFSVYGASLLIGRGYQGRERLEVSDYLAIACTRRVMRCGRTTARDLLLETGMPCGSQLPLPFLFANSDQAGLIYSRRIIRDFELRLPEYVVLRGDFEKMLDDQGREILELNRFPIRRSNFCTRAGGTSSHLCWRIIRRRFASITM